MADTTIVSEKLDQAVDVLEELGVDVWITFGRETSDVAEPALPLVLDEEFVWPGMVLVTKDGDPIVICETHDADTIRSVGLHEVRPYENSLEGVFHETIESIDPDNIAINYSKSNNTADGLSLGLYKLLEEYIESATVEAEFESAEPIVNRVRGVKSDTELERIQRSVDISLELLERMRVSWQPDWSEADVAEFMHREVESRGLTTAWHADVCPAVDAGGEAEWGHAKPSDLTLPQGEVLHLDFGVVYEGYASDMQRLYYRPINGDSTVPDGLQSAFEDVRAAIQAGFETLHPGVLGYEVDTAARETLTDRGWPEYQHGFGHQVGRNVHDGGTYLGPRWERYGDTPNQEVLEGQVFTLELGVETKWGYLGQEEMAVVTSDGAEYLTEPQTAIQPLGE
ncbi:M24 family metallopeptidase [Natrialbaceae archaeon A-CW2]